MYMRFVLTESVKHSSFCCDTTPHAAFLLIGPDQAK